MSKNTEKVTKPTLHLVVETGSLAGGVRVIGEIANRLVARDYPVNIWSVNNKETMTAWFKLDQRVKWYSFLKTGTTVDYDNLFAVLEKQDGYKMATFWRTAPVVAEACKEKGKGLYLVQDIETSYTSQPAFAEAVMKTYELPLVKMTTSRWVEKNLPDTIHVGIGVDTRWYRRMDNVQRNASPLAIVRRQALKGYSQLMEVARYLARGGKRLTTFGLDTKLITFSPIQHVAMPDDRAVRQLYNSHGCFISTSLHEGFSLTPLEAMACGCPVVTSHADGNEEYCEDGVNCLMAHAPAEIAEKTLGLLKDRELASKLSKNALEVPKRYQWDNVIDNICNIML